MRFRLFAIALAVLWLHSPAWAKDVYDMGKVQVTGKDAQSENSSPDSNEISLEMGEKSNPMPEIMPDPILPEKKPLDEKEFDVHPKIIRRDEVYGGYGRGSRNSSEAYFGGKGTYNGYVGQIHLSREARDGYKSYVNDLKTQADAELTSIGEGSYELTVSGKLGSDNFAQRGTRDIPTPDAGIEDTYRSLAAKGHSTLADGAFFSAYGKLDTISRNIANTAVSFIEDSSGFSGKFGGEYKKKIKPQFDGKAAIDIKRDTYSLTDGPDQELTKRRLTLSGEYDFKGRSFLEFGFRDLTLMERSRTAPFINFDYRWAKPWQLYLSYDEDLGNDDIQTIYMPHRYVGFSSLKASHIKRTAGKINYHNAEGDTFGIELFSERETGAMEYFDNYDPGKAMLVSQFRFIPKVKRTGTRIHGGVKLEEHFTLRASTTFQDPREEDSNRRLSYEPKRTLDISLDYRGGPIDLGFSRKALFDRTAYVPKAVDAEDYSRSDLTVKYSINKNFKAYLKIKDLYDEAKKLRYNVQEEGRISLAGVEADY